METRIRENLTKITLNKKNKFKKKRYENVNGHKKEIF